MASAHASHCDNFLGEWETISVSWICKDMAVEHCGKRKEKAKERGVKLWTNSMQDFQILQSELWPAGESLSFSVFSSVHSEKLSRCCAPVFIFNSLLSRPRCGLSIWLSLLAIFNPLLWVYAKFFHEKTDKTREYSAKSAIFVWMKMAADSY